MSKRKKTNREGFGTEKHHQRCQQIVEANGGGELLQYFGGLREAEKLLYGICATVERCLHNPRIDALEDSIFSQINRIKKNQRRGF